MVHENVLPDYLQKVPNLPKIMIQEETKKTQPTIVDIARNLNISPASVSRALRDAGKVGPELKAKYWKRLSVLATDQTMPQKH